MNNFTRLLEEVKGPLTSREIENYKKRFTKQRKDYANRFHGVKLPVELKSKPPDNKFVSKRITVKPKR